MPMVNLLSVLLLWWKVLPTEELPMWMVYILLDVPGDAMISISYVGYKTVDIKVTDKSLARVILKEDTEMLDEVVVVG